MVLWCDTVKISPTKTEVTNLCYVITALQFPSHWQPQTCWPRDSACREHLSRDVPVSLLTLLWLANLLHTENTCGHMVLKENNLVQLHMSWLSEASETMTLSGIWSNWPGQCSFWKHNEDLLRLLSWVSTLCLGFIEDPAQGQTRLCWSIISISQRETSQHVVLEADHVVGILQINSTYCTNITQQGKIIIEDTQWKQMYLNITTCSVIPQD